MPLAHLEHMLVLANDLEATKDWYVRVLGLEVGPHPDFGVPVYWLYLDGQDVIHLTSAREPMEVTDTDNATIAKGGQPIHHVAFRAHDVQATLGHLEDSGVPYIEQHASGESLFQVFVRDPNGIVIELNFAADEVEPGTKAKLSLNL
jgi:catechol 2,3-dioxygenase-like lactoylglutathione lyase family enzyme